MEIHDGILRPSALLSQDSLRLLLLEDFSPEGLVRCSLQQFEARNAPPYRALSYHWGKPEPVQTIQLNGHEKWIHDNLWQFLDQMTLDGDLGYYWTDALCIDQQNIQERNEQVSRMDEIYLRSNEVVVWLGRNEDMQSWMWLVESFYHFEYQTQRTEKRPAPTEGTLEILRDQRTITHSLPTAMSGLLNATYWHRLWVVQEATLAQVARVRCGSFSLLLEHFEAVLGYCRVGKIVSTWARKPDTDDQTRSIRFREPPSTSRALRIMGLNRSGGRELLWELLNEFSDGQCSEPRDRIYSLLSLARPHAGEDRVRDLVGIDYGKQDLEVFWDTIFECDAPFNWLTIMMSQVEAYLQVAGTFETLDEYRRSASVSTRHKRYALIAIEVFWAVRSYQRRWKKTLPRSHLDAMIAGRREWESGSKEDNAIMIGMLLSTAPSRTNGFGQITEPKTRTERSPLVSQGRDEASVGAGNFGRWLKSNSQSRGCRDVRPVSCSSCNEDDSDTRAKQMWSEVQVDVQFRIPGTECRLIIPKRQEHAKMWLEMSRFAMHIPNTLFEPPKQQSNRHWGSSIASQYQPGRMSRLLDKLGV